MAVAISNLLNRGRQIVGVVRFTPHDTTTENGRAKERLRRVGLTALASALAKVISLVTTLISVPLTLNYLGAERYGVWMSISAFIGMLGFADLGMGNGLVSSVAKAHGTDDRQAARRYISSAFFLLLSIGILLFGAFALVSPAIHWGGVFNVADPVVIRAIAPAMLVVVAMFALNMPLDTVQRTQSGYQEGFQSSLWQCIGSLTTLAAVVFAVSHHASLPVLVLCLVGAPVTIVLVNWVTFFGVQRRWLLPSLKYFDRTTAVSLLKTGMLFFILQVSIACAFSSDNIVAAHKLGQQAVTQLSVTARMFGMISLPLAMVLQPLWPAYGEALARGDIDWVRQTLKRSLIMSFGVALLPSLFLALFGNVVLHAWVGSRITVSPSLLGVFAVWTVFYSMGSALAMFLNGIHEVRLQVFCAVSFGVMALSLKIVLAPLWGNTGIIFASLAAWIITALIPIALMIPSILARLEKTRRAEETLITQ